MNTWHCDLSVTPRPEGRLYFIQPSRNCLLCNGCWHNNDGGNVRPQLFIVYIFLHRFHLRDRSNHLSLTSEKNIKCQTGNSELHRRPNTAVFVKIKQPRKLANFLLSHLFLRFFPRLAKARRRWRTKKRAGEEKKKKTPQTSSSSSSLRWRWYRKRETEKIGFHNKSEQFRIPFVEKPNADLSGVALNSHVVTAASVATAQNTNI